MTKLIMSDLGHEFVAWVPDPYDDQFIPSGLQGAGPTPEAAIRNYHMKRRLPWAAVAVSSTVLLAAFFL